MYKYPLEIEFVRFYLFQDCSKWIVTDRRIANMTPPWKPLLGQVAFRANWFTHSDCFGWTMIMASVVVVILLGVSHSALGDLAIKQRHVVKSQNHCGTKLWREGVSKHLHGNSGKHFPLDVCPSFLFGMSMLPCFSTLSVCFSCTPKGLGKSPDIRYNMNVVIGSQRKFSV